MLTDKVTNIEGVVVGPVGIVDSRVPAFIGTNNVVSSGGCNGGEEDEEAKENELS